MVEVSNLTSWSVPVCLREPKVAKTGASGFAKATRDGGGPKTRAHLGLQPDLGRPSSRCFLPETCEIPIPRPYPSSDRLLYSEVENLYLSSFEHRDVEKLEKGEDGEVLVGGEGMVELARWKLMSAGYNLVERWSRSPTDEGRRAGREEGRRRKVRSELTPSRDVPRPFSNPLGSSSCLIILTSKGSWRYQEEGTCRNLMVVV